MMRQAGLSARVPTTPPRKALTMSHPMADTLPPMVGMAEIGAMRDVSASTVSNWRARFSDFPEPILILKVGNVFLEADALAFLARHPNLGGPRPKIPVPIREDVRRRVEAGEDNVAELARVAGISRGSVYLIAGDLLFAGSPS